jgi:hypothetical protein
MVGRSQDGHDQCGLCCGADSLNVQCRRCGYPGDIYTDGTCSRCIVRERVEELLARPDGTVSTQLKPLVEALAKAGDPWSVLAWTRAQRGARLLARLAAHEHDITHDMLDALPQDGAVRRVRAVLVATGALPWRNENLAGLSLWFARTAHQLPPHHAQVIKPFAEWQIIRDARRRAARGPYTAGAAHADRLDIKAAIAFMTWLDEHGRTLHSATQHDLDLYLTTHPAKHRTLGAFLRWAVARRLAAGLAPPKKPWARPSRFLTEQEQLDQLRRCLNDTTLPLEVRIIGAFVRLYAQQVSRIVEFTTDRYTTLDDRAYFTFAHNPVLLPPTLATLVKQQITAPRLNDILAPASDHKFLFPGRPPSRPRSAGSVLSLMRANGLPILSARNTAMIEAVGDLPPVVVSDLFGVAATTAHRWGQLAGESWAGYLAARQAE